MSESIISQEDVVTALGDQHLPVTQVQMAHMVIKKVHEIMGVQIQKQLISIRYARSSRSHVSETREKRKTLQDHLLYWAYSVWKSMFNGGKDPIEVGVDSCDSFMACTHQYRDLVITLHQWSFEIAHS